MLSHVWSSAVQGIEAFPIEIETHIEGGLPRYTVVGLPDNAVRESRDRIWAALKNANLPIPRGKITINLAPADIRKEGSSFDLPIAMGLLAAFGETVRHDRLDRACIVGELALDGTLRPVRGILSIAVGARAAGQKNLLVPAENAEEAAVVDHIRVWPIRHIGDAVRVLSGERHEIKIACHDPTAFSHGESNGLMDFRDVRGQENVKRALEVAAAGGHNALMIGPPGSGKTMLARRLASILPDMTPDESLETTKIHSVGGKLGARHGLVTARPFRAPHHTISDVGLCGGGSNPLPGEISLAHNGVLFLDELPEFRRSVLEVMRQPLEEGRISISRARFTVDYPARFMLLASMNPCPCGYLNDPKRPCVCAPPQIQRYLSRLSGPLIDRIDLHIEALPVPFEQLSRRSDGEPSSSIRKRVSVARRRQQERFFRTPGIHANAQMNSPLVRTFCRTNESGNTLLKRAIRHLGLSARAYDRILKVSRTIADLGGSDEILPEHVAEAIQYRSLDRSWWNG